MYLYYDFNIIRCLYQLSIILPSIDTINTARNNIIQNIKQALKPGPIFTSASHIQQIMANRKQFDYEVLGDFIQDELELRLVIEGLQNFDEQDTQPKSKSGVTATAKYSQGFNSNRTNIQELINRQEYNFKEQLDIEGGKKYRNFKMYQPEKFKLLGYNQQGKPLFKISDLYLTSDPIIKGAFDKVFNQIIHGPSKNVAVQTGELSKKHDKGYDFAKIIENWQKKQYEDFTNDKKNKMNEKQLEEIVVNRGDSKNNYWIYKVGQKKKYNYEDIYEVSQYQKNKNQQYYNHNLLNENFVKNLHKAADRLRMQYARIQQFQSQSQQPQQQKNTNQDQQGQNNKANRSGGQNLYWGEFPIKQRKNNQNVVSNPVKTILLEDEQKQISLQVKKSATAINPSSKLPTNQAQTTANTQTFVEQIIKKYSTVNHQILANPNLFNKQALNEYNRIEFHLQNPNFFLTKLHYALQKKSQQFSNFVQNGDKRQLNDLGLNRNLSIPSASILSGSANQQTVRASQMDGKDQFNQDDDHETIQSKILREMSFQPKKPINHSDVASKLYFIKFSNDLQTFASYHRHEFKYQIAFDKKTKISLMRNLKPLKCKGTDFNINLQKKDSYTKFSKPETLSLASPDIKQFIVIQYIQQNPLLLSDVGMCQRMILQINNKQMLQKINKDLIQEREIQDYQIMRDQGKGSKNNKGNNIGNSNNTELKIQIWRKNVKNYFGDNGKVYLWEPKRQSKLIGNPDGIGVALMESNLAAMPVVKKTPSKRDFLLVREKDRWVIRKIDSLYVSGQVQPKRVVFSPGDRPYQTFLQKFQVDFLTKFALSSNNRITIDTARNYFPNIPMNSAQSRIRKILKQKMNAQTKDNKVYIIKMPQNQQLKFKLQPEQYCEFQRMQKSLCELEQCGIQKMKNMQKMKSILRKYFRKTKNKDLEHFATARMIRDQLQLTSWYLTESFRKFIDKNARIQMVGHADPTNGHGGYSFIKKPQKQRTDKDQAQQKQQKNKLSGTEFDLRKLKAEQSKAILEQRGQSRQQLQKLGRWQLVNRLKSQKDTEYSRKQRESKELKQQNQRKQRSKHLNTLLRYLKNEEQGLIESFEYNYNGFLDLNYYCDREKTNWQIAKEKFQKKMNDVDDGEQDGEEED